MILTIDTEKPISALDLELMRVIVQRSSPIEAAEQKAADPWTSEERALWWKRAVDPEGEDHQADYHNWTAEEAAAVEPEPEEAPKPKPKRKRRTKAEMEAARAAEAAAEAEQDEQVQEAAPEPEAVSEAPAADEAASPSTIEKFRKEAVAKATELVASGGRDTVVTALEAVGAKKVSQIPDDKLAEFVGLLKS